MEALFKKYFWVVKTLGVAIATGLAASAIVTQLGTTFLLDEPGKAAIPRPDDAAEDPDAKPGARPSKSRFPSNPFGAPDPRAGEKQRAADKVLARNIFCPTCVPALPEGTEIGPDGRPVAAGNRAIQPGEIPTQLNLRLVATMVAEPVEYSLATVYDADVHYNGLFKIGDEIREGVTVEGIDMSLLHLKNGAQLEYLEIGTVPKAAPKPTAPTAPKDDKEKPTNPREIPGAADAINCPNENLCIVDRKFVDQILQNPAQLAKQARVVPSQKDGKTQGYKLYGIRRGTLPKLLGLKNGDMITAINGQELTSIDKAMALYTKMRRASRLEVNIVRKGKATTKEIQIQ